MKKKEDNGTSKITINGDKFTCNSAFVVARVGGSETVQYFNSNNVADTFATLTAILSLLGASLRDVDIREALEEVIKTEPIKQKIEIIKALKLFQEIDLEKLSAGNNIVPFPSKQEK